MHNWSLFSSGVTLTSQLSNHFVESHLALEHITSPWLAATMKIILGQGCYLAVSGTTLTLLLIWPLMLLNLPGQENCPLVIWLMVNYF